MLIDNFVYSTTAENPKLYLCMPNLDKTVISRLSEAYNIKLNKKYSNVNTLEFTLPYEIDNSSHQIVTNTNISLIKDRFIVKCIFNDSTEYFTIRVPSDNADDEKDEKSFVCYSLQYELNDKLLRSFTATSYNATEILVGDGGSKTGILDNTLWTIDHIDSEFDYMYRSFEFSSTTVLNSIFDIATSFGAIIIWNTATRKISFYKESNLTSNRGLKASYGKYLKSLTREINSDDICTHLKIYGKNGISIQEVNSTGTNYIEDFSYFQDNGYMSSGLSSSLTTYQNLVATKEPTSDTAEAGSTATNLKISGHGLVQDDYIVNVTRGSAIAKVTAVVDVDNVTVESITGQTTGDTIYLYKDGTFGKLLYKKEDLQETLTTQENDMDTLETELNVITDNIDIANALNNTYNAGTTYSVDDTVVYSATPYTCILESTGNLPTNATYWENLITSQTNKQNEIDAKQNEIDSTNNDIDDVDADITSLRNTIDIENNLTADELLELNQFIVEKEVTNEFIDSAHELLRWATSEFDKIKTPPIALKVNIVDLFKALDRECQIDRTKLVLGETITIYYPKMNINYEAKIIEMNIDFEDSDSLDLTIANIQQILTDEEKVLKMLNKSVSTSTQVDLDRYRWNGAVTDTSEVSQIINGIWDANSRQIQAGNNNNIEISRRGISVKSPDDPLKVVVIQNGIIGLSTDGQNTWKNAITPQGIINEKIQSKLIL